MKLRSHRSKPGTSCNRRLRQFAPGSLQHRCPCATHASQSAAHSPDDLPGTGAPLAYPSTLPKELEGLRISDEGYLVDEKTGKVVNEFGATRFDVAVRALRGELDPPAWVENTERSPGVILSSLMQFPANYLFQIVGKPQDSKQQFIQDMQSCVSRVCQVPIGEQHCQVKDRLGGKYVSLQIEVKVRAPELISKVYDEVSKDSRVVMKF